MSGHPDMRRIRRGSTYNGSDATVVPTQASHPDSEHFFNDYAEASQARTIGRRPPPHVHVSSDESGHHERNKGADKTTSTDPVAIPEPHEAVDAPNSSVIAEKPASNNHTEKAETVANTSMMTVQEVATYLRASVSKIQRLQKRDPDFPSPYWVGGSKFWDRAEIEDYLKRAKAGTRSGR